jgi:hypothetical protein
MKNFNVHLKSSVSLSPQLWHSPPLSSSLLIQTAIFVSTPLVFSSLLCPRAHLPRLHLLFHAAAFVFVSTPLVFSSFSISTNNAAQEEGATSLVRG